MYSIEIPNKPQINTATQPRIELFSTITSAVEPLALERQSSENKRETPTYQQVLQMINQTVGQMKVYVVESEITDTQNAIKTVVQQASF